MAARRTSNRPLQTKAQRNEVHGRAYAYARGLLGSPGEGDPNEPLGSPPYSRIEGMTISQRSWRDGYEAALRDVRQGKRKP